MPNVSEARLSPVYSNAVPGTPEPPRENAPPSRRWPLPARIAFRFVVLLTVLFSAVYLAPEFLLRFPFTFRLGQTWSDAIFSHWMPLVRRVARDVLGVRPVSGYIDATAPSFNQVVSVMCTAVAAAILAVVWSVLDRRRVEYARLYEWLRTYFRFSVAVILTSYGLEKVLLNQFDFPPSPTLLMTPVGDLTPFWMLAAFTASAPIYQVFAGMVELSAGLLLMARRTAGLGALVAVGALANVVVLNYAYHFGMYVLAIALLLMAGVLAAPTVPRLINALVLDRAVPPSPPRALFTDPRRDRTARAFGVIFALGVVTHLAQSSWVAGVHTRPRPPLYGAYEVQQFMRNGDTIPEFSADSSRWRRFTVDATHAGNAGGAARGSIAFPFDMSAVTIRVDSVKRTVTVISPRDRKTRSAFTYSTPDTDHVVLVGIDNLRSTGDSVAISLRRIDLRGLTLVRPQPWFR